MHVSMKTSLALDERSLAHLDVAFGHVLRRLRQQRGLGQGDFADAAHRTYISDLERGLKSPSLRTIAKLANELGISAGELIALAEREAAS